MGRLSYRKRQSLPDSAFALPEKREFPIDTPNRARNALARKHFASPHDQARICAAVHSRYPSIHESSCPTHAGMHELPSGTMSMERMK